MILILGAKGNMGSRYAAILRYLGVPFEGADIDTPSAEVDSLCKNADAIMVATPTDTHYRMLMGLARWDKPIFCEKPLTKNMLEMDNLRKLYQDRSLTMALQYQELVNPTYEGESHYNYFRHGSDGLTWDCIQIIGLARGSVWVGETSPYWDCKLNGQRLSIDKMDDAYVRNVTRWLSGDKQDIGMIFDMHAKTAEYNR